MARKKYSKRSHKRKYRRRKFKRYKELGILGTKHKVDLVYHDSFALNPTSTNAATYLFSLNGMYDPNITGTGHQPRGFDNLMALYDHYVVIACKAEFKFWNADNTYGHMVTTHLQDSPTVKTNVRDIMELKTTQRKVAATRAGGIDNLTLVRTVNPNRFLGRSKPLSDPELKGSASANPTEQAYIQVSCFPVQDGVESGGGYVQARIIYTAILIEPKQPSAS